MRPAGIELDAMVDPQDVIAEDSILWEVFKKHCALGLADLTAPNGDLTPAQQASCAASSAKSWAGVIRGWQSASASLASRG